LFCLSVFEFQSKFFHCNFGAEELKKRGPKFFRAEKALKSCGFQGFDGRGKQENYPGIPKEKNKESVSEKREPSVHRNKVFVRNLANNTAGITAGQNIVGNIVTHNAAAANDNIAANGHAGHNYASAADPYVVTDCNGFGIFVKLVAERWMKRVVGGVEATLRADKYIIAEGYFAGIEKNTVVISVEIVAGFNVSAEADPEIGFNVW